MENPSVHKQWQPASMGSHRGFYEIIGEQEKEGGSQRPNRQMVQFRDAIRSCRLYEVKFIGPM